MSENDAALILTKVGKQVLIPICSERKHDYREVSSLAWMQYFMNILMEILKIQKHNHLCELRGTN